MFAVQRIPVNLQRPDCLLQRLLERPADSHRLAHRLHLHRQFRVRPRKLLESKPGPLHHAVINRRLEASRRLLRNIIINLIKRIPHRQ